MSGAFVLALLLAAPAPAPAQPPLAVAPSKALCTTLRDNVRTALAGLMQNDAIIETGRKAYHKMALDRVAGTTGVASDRLAVENVVAALVHNLGQIDALLADPNRFATTGASGDGQTATAMKTQLGAIADQQKKALNLMSGILETSDFNDAAHIGDESDVMGSTVHSSLTSAPGQNPHVSANADLSGAAAFDRVADEVGAQQVQVRSLESKAAKTVMDAAAQCSRTPGS